LNTILTQNEIIMANDVATRDKDEIRQDNVFELTKLIDGEGDDESESEEEDKQEAPQPTQQHGSPFVYTTEVDPKNGTEEKKDQGLTRPKVLILTGYKRMAYQIVNELIVQFNYGQWKRVIKKKRFKEEFDLNSEEAIND